MISFAQPWVLFLLPVALGWAWLVRRSKPAAFAHLPFGLRHPLLANMQLTSHVPSSPARAWLPWVAALLTLAAAQPQTPGGWLPAAMPARDIWLVIDTSPSMSIIDMPLHGQTVSRMEALKHAADGFIQARQHDRIGMIVFSDHAATLVPLTHDHNALRAQLRRLTPGSTGSATAIGEGLGLAMRQLERQKGLPPLIVLMSDGDNTGGALRPREALAYAQHLGLHLYSIAVTPEPAASNSAAGDEREPTLEEISRLSEGASYQASHPDELQHILTAIDQRESSQPPPPTERAMRAWYPVPLALALALLTLGQWFELRRSSVQINTP